MARSQQSYQRQYRTYGSVAYQPHYDGSAARVPQPKPRPQVRPRRNIVPRPRVQVRQAGAFSPFAVVGFSVVALCAALLLIANAQLMVIKDETVSLRSQLQTLQSEQTVLLAQRELSHDWDAIETQLTANGAMVKLQPGQLTYLSVSEPDSMVLIRHEPAFSAAALVEEIQRFFSDLLS